MARRMLVATAPVGDGEAPIVGLDGQPILTEKSVGDAVRRVTRDLEDMSRRYVRDGWTPEDVTWDIPTGSLVVGKLIVRRDD